MRTVLKVQAATYAAIIALGVTLSACNTLPRVIGAETAQKVEATTLKAAKTSLTVWKITQETVLIYGKLPPCDDEIPDMKICRSATAWAKIRNIEAKTTATILAARPMVEAGTDDVAFLAGVVTAVNEAQIAINSAKKE